MEQSYNRPRVVEGALPYAQEARNDKRIGFWASLDKPLLVIVGVLLSVGAMMVYSTTFDWSLQSRGSNTAIFVQDHLRNLAFGVVGLVFFAVVDYRFWKRFAPWMLLFTVGALVAVLIFGDNTFGARRSLIAGRFQPGELATFTMVLYMSAWLGAKNTRPDSFGGLVSFSILLGIIAIPILLQPDLSSVVIIALTSVMMYFIAGARLWHLGLAFLAAVVVGVAFVAAFPYAQERVSSYVESLNDPTRANYHTQQAIIAFVNGGWVGRGLGQGEQKFGYLPAPHTDSIFAVIGEELGVLGAAVVVGFFIAFVIRGFSIARRAVDPFGSLLAIGFTLWVAIQSLLNIAVMTAVIPSSGLPLPFISYGGSALLVLMIGVGLMLSVHRVSLMRENTKRRTDGLPYGLGGGNGRSRVSRAGSRRSPVSAQ
jgi:cell division protein FtsW